MCRKSYNHASVPLPTTLSLLRVHVQLFVIWTRVSEVRTRTMLVQFIPPHRYVYNRNGCAHAQTGRFVFVCRRSRHHHHHPITSTLCPVITLRPGQPLSLPHGLPFIGTTLCIQSYGHISEWRTNMMLRARCHLSDALYSVLLLGHISANIWYMVPDQISSEANTKIAISVLYTQQIRDFSGTHQKLLKATGGKLFCWL